MRPKSALPICADFTPPNCGDDLTRPGAGLRGRITSGSPSTAGLRRAIAAGRGSDTRKSGSGGEPANRRRESRGMTWKRIRTGFRRYFA